MSQQQQLASLRDALDNAGIQTERAGEGFDVPGPLLRVAVRVESERLCAQVRMAKGIALHVFSSVLSVGLFLGSVLAAIIAPGSILADLVVLFLGLAILDAVVTTYMAMTTHLAQTTVYNAWFSLLKSA